MADRVDIVKVRHRAKFCSIWLGCCRDMAIYHFVQYAGRLPSWIS